MMRVSTTSHSFLPCSQSSQGPVVRKPMKANPILGDLWRQIGGKIVLRQRGDKIGSQISWRDVVFLSLFFSLRGVILMSSCRQVSRTFSFHRNAFFVASSFALFRRFVSFVASFVSSCRRVLRFVDDGINKSAAVTGLFPPFPVHVIEKGWREK